MIQTGERGIHPPPRRIGSPATVYERWIELYGELVAAQLKADRRYTLIRLGSADFAFTDTDCYLRALGQAWDAGLVPQPRPNTLGSRLPEVAPNLQGIDLDLGDLTASDVEPTPRRFS
jgi:hypothetical protein